MRRVAVRGVRMIVIGDTRGILMDNKFSKPINVLNKEGSRKSLLRKGLLVNLYFKSIASFSLSNKINKINNINKLGMKKKYKNKLD